MLNPQFAIKATEATESFAKLEFEPLESGYGHTVGNALRRTLLTSIKGAAITKVKIDKVKHKFSTLDGMKEDVVELILNFKQIRVKYSGEKPIEIHLDVSGKKEVKAGDIECPSEVEIANKDLVLARLTTAKAKLKAVITVEAGYGYELAQEKEVTTVGVIPLDSAFSPVRRVKYEVRQTRVGRRTDFDKLILDIWTDGTVEPQDAVLEAANTLIAYFNQIVNPIIPEVKEEIQEDPKELEIMRLTVEELDLPTRIANALRKGGLKTVKDLSEAKQEDIAKVKNLGTKSVKIVIEKLAAKGVALSAIQE
jgi:DNA-directed RNA polymerase subunit alpha